MTYFRENENSGPYFDINHAHIPQDEADNYYKSGNMHPSSIKDYETNRAEVNKATKRFVGLIKSIRNSSDSYNF